MLAMDSGSVADAAQGQIHDVCKGHIVDLVVVLQIPSAPQKRGSMSRESAWKVLG